MPVKARPFLTIRAEPISEDPTGDVQKTIFKLGSGVRDAVVRLQLVGPRAKVEAVNEKEVRAQLREAYYLLPFQREYTDKQRPVSLGEDLQGRTPLDILDLYFERRSVKPERRQQLLACARELMADEPAVGSRQ